MTLSLNDYISIFIHQTDLELTSYVKNKLSPFNIAPEQNLIMMLLWEHDGRSQNEIAAKLNKDKTNIARMSYGLEQKGFIKRRMCPNDRRVQRLYLTESGLKLKKHIIPIAEQFNTLVCQNITTEEINQLRKILLKMRANLT
ncbi:MarR family winged helix-turn-helix transcriptional regulator [Bacillus sp. AFS040349]|uniref:MarR family winged helix-turn-helix transcriptional regulator n=1 Tax=Bacillus sp. AFS040349 TaxID=2033502 RepID=UPI000BFD2A20|nr:MarR family transcriptional regulator [Bacillus sp. AFS040349]PGT81998.1 MarR family transcriptional regulator [Bacillus sp. AFS040349]